MHLIGLARLGANAIIRFTPDGKPVANLALAFNYGKKNEAGKQPTQWVDASFWGDRAQKLEQWLVKGQLLEVHLVDPHIEAYTNRDGTQGTKLVAMVNHLEFAGSPPQQTGQQPSAQQQASQQRAAQPNREQARDRQHAASNQRGAADTFADLDDLPPF